MVTRNGLARNGHLVCGQARENAMVEPRLKSALWVQSALRMADIAGRAGAVLRRGDGDAGGVLAVLRARAGLAVLVQTRTAEGEAAWLRGTGEGLVDQETADAYVARQVARDPDLWVVEFDAPDGQPPFVARLM
jgi:hypothetical protein